MNAAAAPPSQVTILHWPEAASAVAYLRAHGRPRLLLVAPDEAPPVTSGWDEDWVRLPASEEDVRARAEALEARARTAHPEVTSDGRLLFGGRWVSLSPTEATMMRVLCDRFGEVTDIGTLTTACAAPTSASVRVHLTRLRKRIAPLGLAVRAVRQRGYVLDSAG